MGRYRSSIKSFAILSGIQILSVIVVLLIGQYVVAAEDVKPMAEGSPAATGEQAETKGDAAATVKPIPALPQLASLVAKDERVEAGELISMTRPFDNWILRCDLRLSQNKRLCAVEQVVTDGVSSVRWRVANSTAGKPLLIISVPAHMMTARGMKLSFSGLEKAISEKEWFCSEGACVTGFAFDGFVQAAIMHSEAITFEYSINTNEGEKVIELAGTMVGFEEAVSAGAADPFGETKYREAAAKRADEEKKAAAEGSKKKSELKPVAAAPKASPSAKRAAPKRPEKAATRPRPQLY